MFWDNSKGKVLVHEVACGIEDISSLFSNLGTKLGECAASRPGRFPPAEIFPYAH